MSKLKWDKIEERFFETGCDHGVLYVQKEGQYPEGVVWNGLTQVTESPSGAEPNDIYADNIKYLSLRSAETYGATIECYTYPKEFKACNGETEALPGVTLGQQRRKAFGFSYRTKKGNAEDGEDYGYILHLIYGGTASPSEQGHETINESPSAVTMSFEVSTTPVDVSGKGPDGKPYRPVSSLTIDSTEATRAQMDAIEKVLYGSDDETGDSNLEQYGVARLPLPDEVIEILKNAGETSENPVLPNEPGEEEVVSG